MLHVHSWKCFSSFERVAKLYTSHNTMWFLQLLNYSFVCQLKCYMEHGKTQFSELSYWLFLQQRSITGQHLLPLFWEVDEMTVKGLNKNMYFSKLLSCFVLLFFKEKNNNRGGRISKTHFSFDKRTSKPRSYFLDLDLSNIIKLLLLKAKGINNIPFITVSA